MPCFWQPMARCGPIDEVAWYRVNSGERTHELVQKRAQPFGPYEMLVKGWSSSRESH
jgi:sulfatase modifying factor 1